MGHLTLLLCTWVITDKTVKFRKNLFEIHDLSAFIVYYGPSDVDYHFKWLEMHV